MAPYTKFQEEKTYLPMSLSNLLTHRSSIRTLLFTAGCGRASELVSRLLLMAISLYQVTCRLIFPLFMEGKTPSSIAKYKEKEGVLSPSGKEKWRAATVNSILSNEKYKGDALLQKSYTVDFLTKTIKTNEGELPQYYVQNFHPAIIDPDESAAVQIELERSKKTGRSLRC